MKQIFTPKLNFINYYKYTSSNSTFVYLKFPLYAAHTDLKRLPYSAWW